MTPRRSYAVVGYAVRFPGAANADEFWDLLSHGRHTVSEVPPDRWDVDQYFDPNPEAPLKMVTRRAGFIDDVAGFDASFFGVSPREANTMDPQHRLMLETAWSAIEHAGIAPSDLVGTRTGVYMGLSTHEYLGMLVRFESVSVDLYSGTGTSPAAGAGRISFLLALQGPAMAVDTACSSSLVAVHQACQALDSGDCDAAIVGGVNVILTPVPMIAFSKAQMLAPDGKCKTFDAAADGFVRGEGCGVIVVKRLEDALRDDDRIRAVIRGSAVNQDGASGGLTVPNGGAQQRVIAEALERAGLMANEVDYLEAHGTGTSLGDPIELQAAGAVFGEGRDPDAPLLVGSVKTNIGHLEAAAGIAGLIKVILSLENDTLAQHLHFRTPSPYIAWDRLPVRVVAEATPWQRGDRPRVAGVSSFGFAGTNAHVLVEEAPIGAAAADGSGELDGRKSRILPLSAQTPEALTELAARYQDWLEANPDAALADICATAGAGRSHFKHRAALVVDSTRRTRRLLRAMGEDRPAPGLLLGSAAERPKTAFLFTGQGSEYPGMARELLETEPVFRDTVTRCSDALNGVLQWPLVDVLSETVAAGPKIFCDTAFAQPALFAVEMGLARLWQSWGVEPDVVLGHALGLYAAACVAGVFGLEDGARLIGERARLFSGLPAGGGMVAVFADADRVEECTVDFPELAIAAYDGISTVLSGPSAELEKAIAPLTAAGVRCERLDVQHAFHSALIDPALEEFESFAAGIEYSSPQVTVICNRTGEPISRQTRMDAAYWRRHARQAVRFADSVRTLGQLGCAVLVELGPASSLTSAAMQIWPDTAATPTPIASLRRDADAQRVFTEALAAAYIAGHRLDFASHKSPQGCTVDLPTYPFQHRPYWIPNIPARRAGPAEISAAPATPHEGVARTTPIEHVDEGRTEIADASAVNSNGAIPEPSPALQPIAPLQIPAGPTALVEQLTPAPLVQRKKMMLEYLRTTVSEVTRLDVAEIHDETGFFDLGMDSLMAVELHQRLERGLGAQLPATLAMDHPRLDATAEYLLNQVLHLGAPTPAPAQRVPAARTDDPIAIVGLACRFPGASDLDAFWEVLTEGVDAISEIPGDRFNVDEFYDPDPDTPGKLYSRHGGFLDGIDGFDPEFFGISPREAMSMDPQQRLVLETAWESLEHAGYSPTSLRGSLSGVYVGVGANEYSHLLASGTAEGIEPHFITGNAINVIAGRLAFTLGLEGPAMVIDTACSSSLVAVHQACQALLSSECDLALAGGVNVVLSPATSIAISRARMLSPDGRCKAFDTAADGYVRSEGCGVLVLKRLSDAVRDGDRIRAVISGSAVNQDGASGGLTVPNGGAQQRVISAALNRAGIAGGDVDYLEAHGTGTALGDPIEVQAAGAVFGADREPHRPLLIGSVKTNIGHLEAAAGIAGLIKVVLSLEHEMLPRQLHFHQPSPYIPWDRLPVRVVDEATPWRTNGRPRRAGVSSFGFSGTNAHVLLEESPPKLAGAEDVSTNASDQAEAEAPAPAVRSIATLPLSGRSAQALAAVAQRYAAWLTAHPEVDIADVCYTAGVGRSHFEHRAALVVDSVATARDLLSAIAEGQVQPGAARGTCAGRPKTAWLFTGQGSQYPGMARELFDSEPVFADTVTRCAQAIDGILDRPLIDVLFDADGDESLRDTTYAQPALFAVEMGLARLWQSWGIEPDVVIGHSVGQYSAACVAGVLSLEDGARLMAHRGRMFGSLPEGGRMVAIFADAESVEALAGGYPQVSVAAYNGANTVLSGPGADLEVIAAGCIEDGIRCTWLETSHAFHSALLDPVLDEFETYAALLEYTPPTIPLICNLTGQVLTWESAFDAKYWREHARQPVRFAESVRTLADLGATALMEIGPQPTLTATALRAWPDSAPSPQTITSLRKGADSRRHMAEALAGAYTAGHRPDFVAAHHRPRQKLDLPSYPFQRRSCWFSGISSLPELHRPESLLDPMPQIHWLADLTPEDRLDRVTELLRTELGTALGKAAADIDPDAEFVSLGMDSLIAMELRRRIQTAFGTSVPASLFFTHPTVPTLAEGLLKLWSESTSDPGKRQVPIPRVKRESEVPLSHAQEQLWFLNELLPSSSAYNVAIRIDVPGELDRDVLRRSLDALVARHEVLRTTFHSAQGVPQSLLVEPEPFKVPFERLGPDDDVDSAALREANVTFDIGTGPLLRARLFGLDDGRNVLVLTMHHIVTDGWSFRVLLRDLGTIYQALAQGEPIPLEDLPIQYADYAEWQAARLQGPEFDALLEYWKNDLAGAPALELDTDRPRPKTPTFQGARIRFELGRERAARLRELCRSHNIMLSVPLLAAFSAVLSRYSGQDDMVIGTLTANRDRVETEELIGFFANALPVRVRLDGEPTVAEYLGRVKRRIVEVLAHQDVPFDLIVNATSPDREASKNPIFGVQLVVQPSEESGELNGLNVQVAEVDTQTAKRDLTLTFFDDDRLSAHVEYASELFDRVRIERLMEHFRLVIDEIVRNPEQRLSALPMLSESETAYYQSSPAPRASAARSIPEMFELTVDRAPDARAVTTAAGTLTYRELDDAANRLARRLRSQGVEPGAAVALRVDRTSAMPIGMLGILKAGCVYVPVDPSYPQDRIEHMLGDAGVTLLLDEEAIGAVADEPCADRLETVISPDDLAYVMYTSGSTGRPKGVAITHGSVVEYAETLGHDVGVTADDVYLETASISFSSSIRQILMPFAVGAEVVIATTEERRDPIAMLRRVVECGVTVADLVPTVVRRVVDAVADAPPHQEVELLQNRLRLLLTASEPLRVGVVRAWRERMGAHIEWVNMYGQTETTGIVSLNRLGELRGNDQAIVPIGRPRGNIGMHVLDPQMRHVPPGVTGELYISGSSLAREYVGAPELTAQKFVPAAWDPDERLYTSGDVVRLGWDGTIEFRSRADRQVKIRGLRVEPAEIDRVLLEHPGVREVVTVVKEMDDGENVLVAYFAPEDEPVSASDLRAHARRQLPDHMVPTAFHALESLPQTPNGKLDRNALPDVAITRDQEIEFVAPRAGVEESLASIWRDTLQVDQIGAGDNFFELGGHSLLAAQVRSRIHQLLGVELPLEALFEDQTLSDLARRVENTGHADDSSDAPPLEPAPRTQPIPLSYAQELMWQLERDEPGSPGHWIEVSIRITGPLDPDLVAHGIQDAAQRHELLRSVFRQNGTSVSQVILDSYVPEVPIRDDASGAESELHEGNSGSDLDNRPPYRAELVRVADDNHILHVRAHRIIADGYTMRLVLGEIGGLIASSAGFAEFPLLDGDLQYADYAIWERAWLTGEVLQRRIDYFRERFATGIPPAMPTDRPRSGRPNRHAHQYAFEFPGEVADAARALAVREQASLYSVLIAAFAAALGKYAGRDTVVITSPVSRRNDEATQLIIGPFMNNVPLRIDLANRADMAALVRSVKAEITGALSNQDAPWQHVLTALAAEHGSAALGIGEVVFLMDEPAPGEMAAGGFTLSRVAPASVAARRELTVAVNSKTGGITGVVTYDHELFDAETIERIVSEFISALTVPPTDRTQGRKSR